MNRGDTGYLMLNYTLNGDPLEENAYQEIELQINSQAGPRSVTKLLSKGDIRWGTLSYEDKGVQKTFTGYYASFSQEETFKLSVGKSLVQLRIMVNDEVASSAVSDLTLGETLSGSILVDPA